MKSEGITLRRCTRRYSSQRDEFYHRAKQILAGGLIQFDSSGDGPKRQRGVRAVSPHPDPLPSAFAARQSAAPARRRLGEGTARTAQRNAASFGLYSARSRVHPLPEGEGWGEGKQTTARRRGKSSGLVVRPMPQGYMALSHSRFQAFGFAGGL